MREWRDYAMASELRSIATLEIQMDVVREKLAPHKGAASGAWSPAFHRRQPDQEPQQLLAKEGGRMSTIILCLISFWLGGIFGGIVMAALSAGSNADDRMGLL